MTLILHGLPQAAQAQDWTASAGLSSDYRLRGVSLSNGHAAQALDLGYGLDSGWSLGLGLAALGRDDDGLRTLMTASLARAWQWDADWGAELDAAHYAYPGPSRRRAYDYDELRASLLWRGIWTAALSLSPHVRRTDGYGHYYGGQAGSAEAGLRLPLGRGFGLDAGLGVYRLQASVGSGSYAYGNLGLAWAKGPWQAQLGFVTSNAAAKGLASRDNAAGGWLAALIWSI